MPMVFPEQRAGASQLPPGASGVGVEGATGCANEVNEVEQSRTQESAAFENSLLMALNTPTEKHGLCKFSCRTNSRQKLESKQ